MTTKAVIYARPDDPITERIVSEFDDFGGFSDGGPVNPKPRRARSSEAFSDADATLRLDDAPTSENIDFVPSNEVAESLLGPRCPSCHVQLPHPTHLVSNSMLASLPSPTSLPSMLSFDAAPVEQIVDVELPEENSPL